MCLTVDSPIFLLYNPYTFNPALITMLATPPDDLSARIALGLELHALTRDPMLPSAISLLTRHLSPTPWSEQAQKAYNMVNIMADAHLTLFGASVISRA